MGRLAACVADQKDTVVLATGVAVGEIGIGAFDPHSEIIRYEQVKNSVDAVRCDAFSTRGGNQFGNVIGRSGARKAGQRIKDSRPGISPFLSGFFQIGACRVC